MNANRSLDNAIVLTRLTCYGFLAFALCWWLASIPSLDWPARILLDVSDWPLDGNFDNMERGTRFVSAIGASLLAGLSLLLLLVVVPEIERGNRSIIRGTLIAIFTWYATDSVGCILLGIYSNAVLNTFYLALIAIPLLLAQRALRINHATV